MLSEFDKNEITLTFETNGGGTIGAIVQKSGTAIQKPQDPAKVGYTFDDWYIDEDFSAHSEFNTMPNKNTVVYAKWVVNNYMVTFMDPYNMDVITADSITEYAKWLN